MTINIRGAWCPYPAYAAQNAVAVLLRPINRSSQGEATERLTWKHAQSVRNRQANSVLLESCQHLRSLIPVTNNCIRVFQGWIEIPELLTVFPSLSSSSTLRSGPWYAAPRYVSEASNRLTLRRLNRAR